MTLKLSKTVVACGHSTCKKQAVILSTKYTLQYMHNLTPTSEAKGFCSQVTEWSMAVACLVQIQMAQ